MRYTTVAAEERACRNPFHDTDSNLTRRDLLVGLLHFATTPLMIESI